MALQPVTNSQLHGTGQVLMCSYGWISACETLVVCYSEMNRDLWLCY